MDRSRVVIAEILRPRGNRGELLCKPQSDVPRRAETLKAASVRLSDGEDLQVEIQRIWSFKDFWVLALKGVDSIDAADRFRGADLWVPAYDRGALNPGEFFQSDLIGCRVVDKTTGNSLGEVRGWQQYGGPPLMELEVEGREVLVPFVDSICRVDLETRTIAVDLPEGLLEL